MEATAQAGQQHRGHVEGLIGQTPLNSAVVFDHELRGADPARPVESLTAASGRGPRIGSVRGLRLIMQ